MIKYAQFIPLSFSVSQRESRIKLLIPNCYSATSSRFLFCFEHNRISVQLNLHESNQGWPLCIQRAQHFSQVYWLIVFLLSHAHFTFICYSDRWSFLSQMNIPQCSGESRIFKPTIRQNVICSWEALLQILAFKSTVFFLLLCIFFSYSHSCLMPKYVQESLHKKHSRENYLSI